jgi:hypothetical protein
MYNDYMPDTQREGSEIIISALYYFKQTVPFELLFNIPVLIINLKLLIFSRLHQMYHSHYIISNFGASIFPIELLAVFRM